MAIARQISLRFGASQNWFRMRVFMLYIGLCLNRFLLYTSLHSYLECFTNLFVVGLLGILSSLLFSY